MSKIMGIFQKQSPWPIFSLLISLFWVIFLWNFWDKGVYALGINAGIFLGLLLIFFNNILAHNKLFIRRNVAWLLPIIFIVGSFFIYDNPFIKIVSILTLPILVTIFINYSFLNRQPKEYWSISLFFTLLFRLFVPFTKLKKSAQAHDQLVKMNNKPVDILKKIILGLATFISLSMLIIIPLLSSADPEFASSLGSVYQWLTSVISLSLLMKIIVFYAWSLFFYAVFLGWQNTIDVKDTGESYKKLDSIVLAIVIGGILLLYILFLWLQVERLWVNGLPSDFQAVEVLVKSGFWQLVFLSVINIVILFFIYKKTNKFVQGLLTFFTIASLLLLVSAGYRMFLYIVFHGLSYEKFFAAYTVLYCAILFIYLIMIIVTQRRLNIIKFVLFLFLWMYGSMSILPVEQIILKANIALAKNGNSRINLNESMILSPDILSYVEKYNDQDFMKINRDNDKVVDWTQWLEDNKNIINNKQWYELNFHNILYKFNQ